MSNDEFILKCLKEKLDEEDKKESESSEEIEEDTIPWHTMVEKTDV